MILGDIIKKYRADNGISLRDFASRCKLSHTYISALEKNLDYRTNKPISPTLDAVKEVARAMRIDLDSLLKMMDDNQLIEIPADDNKIPVLRHSKSRLRLFSQ